MTGDNLTVLTTTTGKFATKQFSLQKDGTIKNRSYGNETFFSVASVPVTDIHSLASALDKISRNARAFIIRGEPLPRTNRVRTRRLSEPDRKTGEPATFEDQPRHWFSVDVDKIGCPALTDPVMDPEGTVEYVIGLMPPELHDATCWWQFSSSQSVKVAPGTPDTLSLHLWYWLAEPLGSAALTRWAIAANQIAGYKLIGPEFFRTVQAHYTAAPIFNQPLKDPLPRRCGLRKGLDDAVNLIIPQSAPKRPYEPSKTGYEPGMGVAAHLREIGGPKGNRGPIMATIASYVAIHGSAADVQPLYQEIRTTLDRVAPGWQTDPDGRRYLDVAHLDKITDWVRQHHGDQPPKGFHREPPPHVIDPEIPLDKPEKNLVNSTGVEIDDFHAYMLQHNYMYAPARDLWPGSSVDARLPPVLLLDANGCPLLDEKGKQVKIAPTAWLDKHKPVEQLTWAPGLPMIIKNRLISEGGWIERDDVNCFNLYRPPLLAPGDPKKAGEWIAHVEKIYPDDAGHIIRWLAQRVQHPEDKINHALVLGGLQGIGKDSLIEPVKRAVGPWNVAEPSPAQLVGRFNGFAKSVILRISEAHDLGDINRYAFYEHLKVYAAAPPDVLRVEACRRAMARARKHARVGR